MPRPHRNVSAVRSVRLGTSQEGHLTRFSTVVRKGKIHD
jgi:hypothetical protein